MEFLTGKNLRQSMVAVILGGGRGTRLYPLTHYRSKPAVPVAGKYRLIDVTVSNCIHSGLRNIFVLTQFNSASLNRHVSNTYRFDQFTDGFVEILAAEQTHETENWFQGTADAVRKSLRHILTTNPEYILIMSGDTIYRMDLGKVLEQHLRDEAEITVCCGMVGEDRASSLGLVTVDAQSRITDFHEKPPPEELHAHRADPGLMKRWDMDDPARPYLASMGTYLFHRDVLLEMLNDMENEDFGRQLIPNAISRRRVHAHLFAGYWEDIGTIRSFFDSTLDLVSDQPKFDFYDPEAPVFTRARTLPSSAVLDTRLNRVLVAEGCIINRAEILNSVIGIRSVIGDGSRLENVVMMGADYYDNGRENGMKTGIALGVGRDVIVRNAIIDKNARIGDGVRILNEAGVQNGESPHHWVRDGIVIIPKDATIPPGTVL